VVLAFQVVLKYRLLIALVAVVVGAVDYVAGTVVAMDAFSDSQPDLEQMVDNFPLHLPPPHHCPLPHPPLALLTLLPYSFLFRPWPAH